MCIYLQAKVMNVSDLLVTKLSPQVVKDSRFDMWLLVMLNLIFTIMVRNGNGNISITISSC